MRVVVISHGHPEFTRGGGEIAAWNVFEGINAKRGHEAWFLARAPRALLHLGTSLAQHGEREYLFAGEAEVENLAASMELGPEDEFAQLLKRLKPDVIHFHHYYKVGIELIRVARQACPKAKIVLTFHEFMAICVNHGTMVKTDMRLCYKYELRDCQHCFPDKGPDWFFLRERYLKSFFSLVDTFISPSHFVAERYIEWGLDPNKMQVIENGISEGPKQPLRKLAKPEARLRFAFFGQAHPYKGLDFIIEAIAALPAKIRDKICLDIHAHGLEYIEGPHRKKLDKLLKKHKSFAHFHGSYEQSELPKLMRETDWVLMGSIWWENSPLVIQEAWKFGRPVICPDLGGMAEKVKEGVGGLVYRARDGVALGNLIKDIANNNTETNYDNLIAKLPDYTSIEQSVSRHVKLFKALAAK